MPRGTLRRGLRVSSAAVATTSNPMNAKNTVPAPAKMPKMPPTDSSAPDANENSVCVHTVWCTSESPNDSVDGMNGLRFDAEKYVNPTAMMSSTMPTLMAVSTAVNRVDSLVPTTSIAVSTPMSSTVPQSNVIPAPTCTVLWMPEATPCVSTPPSPNRLSTLSK